MPGIRKNISYFLEYAAARTVIALMRAAPYRLALRFGGWLGYLAWRRFRLRRGEVLASLARAFPEKTPAELEALGQANYCNLGRWFVEMFLVPSLSLDWMRGHVELEGREALEAAYAEGRGVVGVTFHFGDWELMGAFTARLGYPLDAIARGQKNPWFHRYITRMRAASGMRLIPVTSSTRLTARALREGRMVGFYADQDAHADGEFVEFLGRSASTPRGPALYAFRCGSPAVLTIMLPQPDGRWRLHIERIPRPATEDRDEFVREMTTWFTKRLEEYVRANPEYWFWPHRRWKTRPPLESDRG
jgi:Kdo2-lipid IVA lauroyltransferase/acyltransferase